MASSELPPAPSSAPVEPPLPVQGGMAPCERCGTFIQGAPVELEGLQVCPACAALAVKGIKLYPSRYVLVLALLTPILGGTLAAINWKRLRSPGRMWLAIILAVHGVALSAFNYALGFPAFVEFIVSIVGRDAVRLPMAFLYRHRMGFFICRVLATLLVLHGMKITVAQYRKAGAATANLGWPLLIFFLFLLTLVQAVCADLTR
jgi:hypothetical protein